jgi:hypothetical protein
VRELLSLLTHSCTCHIAIGVSGHPSYKFPPSNHHWLLCPWFTNNTDNTPPCILVFARPSL